MFLNTDFLPANCKPEVLSKSSVWIMDWTVNPHVESLSSDQPDGIFYSVV